MESVFVHAFERDTGYGMFVDVCCVFLVPILFGVVFFVQLGFRIVVVDNNLGKKQLDKIGVICQLHGFVFWASVRTF